MCGKANFFTLASISGRNTGLGLLVSYRWSVRSARYIDREDTRVIQRFHYKVIPLEDNTAFPFLPIPSN